MIYGAIGGGILTVMGVIFASLNAANKRSKDRANGYKRRRFDPDAPLEYMPPPTDWQPPAE